jgi:hypothetical protein
MSLNDKQHDRGDVQSCEGTLVMDESTIVDEIIDIEEFAKKKIKPPHARGYRIRIDKEYKEVHVPVMTGRQILALVGKTPETYLLSQKLHGGQVIPIGADQRVDFRHPGIERFQTLALDPTEGENHASRIRVG